MQVGLKTRGRRVGCALASSAWKPLEQNGPTRRGCRHAESLSVFLQARLMNSASSGGLGSSQPSQAAPVRIIQSISFDRQRVAIARQTAESASDKHNRHHATLFFEDDPDSRSKWCKSPTQALREFLRKIYLPVDYPASVTPNYIEFVQAMTLQVFFSHVSRVLATQAMLLAVGVGSNVALPLAAVTAWVLKDGLGHIGAITFGTCVNTRFDSDPKRFRFQASVLGKIADTLSVLTLGRPHYFLLLSTLGSAFGRISASAALSCRAKIYETFALQANLGDVLRCSQAQAVTAQLAGTLVGAMLGPLIGSNMLHILMWNGCLAGCSLHFSYKSSESVRMHTFNVQRAELVFHDLVERLICHYKDPSFENNFKWSCLTIQEVQEREVFVSRYKSVFTSATLLVNPPLGDFTLLTSIDDLEVSQYALAVLGPVVKASPFVNLAMWYHTDAASEEIIRGFFHTAVFRGLLTQVPVLKAPEFKDVVDAHAQSKELAETWWPHTLAVLQKAGWRLDVAFLGTKDHSIRFKRCHDG